MDHDKVTPLCMDNKFRKNYLYIIIWTMNFAELFLYDAKWSSNLSAMRVGPPCL